MQTDFKPEVTEEEHEGSLILPECLKDDIAPAAEPLTQSLIVKIPVLTQDQIDRTISSKEFSTFIDKSSKIIERALEANRHYNIFSDYTSPESAEVEESATRNDFKLIKTFISEKMTKSRAVTDLEWCVKYPELILASYNKSSNTNSLNIEPDGLIGIWNLNGSSSMPEFVLNAQSEIKSCKFISATLIAGGLYSGKICIWDTSTSKTPILTSSGGHSHPVYSIRVVGSGDAGSAKSLITACMDGNVCSWHVDTLSEPQDLIGLVVPSQRAPPSITCIGIQSEDSSILFIGTEEGNIYQVNRFGTANW